MNKSVKPRKKSDWQVFVGKRMAEYMKKYGSHGEAMKMLSIEWKKNKGGKVEKVKASTKASTKKNNVKAYHVKSYTRKKRAKK